MAADFLLKQNIRMSPNAQIKNLVPENLSEVPPEDTWKLGRIWFNSTIGKFQCVFKKLDTATGLPLVPETWEVGIIGVDRLGPTTDGQYWPDGLFDFTQDTKIADAMDDVNEALKELAPPEATFLRGDMQLTGQSFRTGKISRYDPYTMYEFGMDGVTAGQEINYIVTNPLINATLPTAGVVVKGQTQEQFGRADQGFMVAMIDNRPTDTGLNLKTLFNEAGREYFDSVQGFDPDVTQLVTNADTFAVSVAVNPSKMSYRSSSGSLTIRTIKRYNEFKKWQVGTGSVRYTVEAGRHTLHVEHDKFDSGHYQKAEIELEAFKTNKLEVFYDPSVISPVTVINSLVVATGDKKYASGLYYYNSNISFTLNFTATEVFTYTYWDKPIVLTMDGTTLGEFAWNHASSNLHGLSTPLSSDVFTLTNFNIVYDSPKTMTESVTLTSRAGKPATDWGLSSSKTLDMLIDTYSLASNSTSIKETFRDEEYRIQMNGRNSDSLSVMQNSLKNTWNSTLQLVAGEAQQYMGKLQKAKDEYSKYGINVDYRPFANNTQYYYRMFYDKNSQPNSNGKIKVVTNGVFGTDFEIQIKLPGLTGWLNVGKLLDTEIFTDSYRVDGTGCGTNYEQITGGYILSWSAGTLSTVNSGFGYLIKVIIKTNNFSITELSEIADTWS